jgi:3-oxoacyl-[acyl-carrier-protein] synthase II
VHRLIDKKSARRYDDCLKYTMVAGKKALAQAGLDKDANAAAFSGLDLTRCGVLVGSGMGGLSVFQDGASSRALSSNHRLMQFAVCSARARTHTHTADSPR